MSGEPRDVERVITPPSGIVLIDLRELWAYRELFGFMVWRDVSVRYKQSVLGILWALVTPLGTMLIFTIIFGKLAKIPPMASHIRFFRMPGSCPGCSSLSRCKKPPSAWWPSEACSPRSTSRV